MTASPNGNVDAEILRALRTDPREGLGRLIDCHGEGVLRYLRRELRFGKRHEEVMHDAIVEAALIVRRRIDNYDPSRGTLGGYFGKIALNEALRLLAAERRRRVHETTFDQLESVIPKLAMDGGPARDSAFPAEFAEFVETLSPIEKAILRADLVDGHRAAAEDLARELGTSVAAVHSLRYRRNRKIERWLERFGGGAK